MKPIKVVFTWCPIGLFLLLSILLAPQRGHGWGNTWMGASLEQIINSAQWKAGLLRFNAAFTLNNAGYDSDIYFGSTTTRVPDYILRAGIPFQLLLPLNRKIIFDISEIPQYVFYLKTKAERALNNDFRGHIHLVFDRVYFQAGGGLSNIKQQLSPELTLNIRQNSNFLNGLVLWQVSAGGSLALQYQTSAYTYDNPVDSGYNISKNLNRRENFLNFTAYLQQVSKTRFFLDAEYGSYVFAEAPSSSKDSRSYGIYGGVDFLPSPEGLGQARGVQGRIDLGFQYFNILNPQLKDYSGLVGNTSISIPLMKLTSVRGFFSRDIQFSAFSSLSYYIITSYGGGLSRSLTRRSRVEYELSFIRGVYPSDGTTNGTPPQGAPIRYVVNSLTAIFQLRRDLEFRLIGNLGTRNMNAIFPGGNRYFVGFSLTYGASAGEVSVLPSLITR